MINIQEIQEKDKSLYNLISTLQLFLADYSDGYCSAEVAMKEIDKSFTKYVRG